MKIGRLALLALALGLVLGSAADAAASGRVKHGASGNAYYWQSGSC